MSAETHAHPPYVKIYLTLLALFAVSVLGPTLGIWWLTLVTAFGIAVIKATMVAAYFMHINIEPRYIRRLMYVMLAFMLVLFAGVAPDVMKHEGKNWRQIDEVRAAPSAAHH